MYKIEETSYGYRLTFEGFVKKTEINEWYNESLEILREAPDKFGVLADLRTMKTLPMESQDKLEAGQKHFKQKGMTRSAVILDNPIIAMQFKRIGKNSGIYQWERYLDASTTKDWESRAIKWIEDNIDPD